MPTAQHGYGGALLGVQRVAYRWWASACLEAVAELVRQTEIELRALTAPPDDRLALEQHFLRPWAELAEYLESLLAAPRTRWLSANGAIELLEGGPANAWRSIGLLHRVRAGRQPSAAGRAGGRPAARGQGGGGGVARFTAGAQRQRQGLTPVQPYAG